TGIGVDHLVAWLHAPPRLDHVRDLPAVLATLINDRAVEGVEDLLARKSKRVKEGGDRKLALAVDADVDDVLGVEFEIEPASAIGDHARGEEIFAAGVGLSAIVVEQHTRRTVHLADDDAPGA